MEFEKILKKILFLLFLIKTLFLNCGNFYGLVLATKNFKIDDEIRKKLKNEGIELIVKSLDEPINFERLKLFNFVIFIGEGDGTISSVPVFVPREFVIRHFNYKNNIKEILKYVENGGSLFFIPNMSGGGIEMAEVYNEFLKNFGIKILSAQVRDDAHSTCKNEYSFTTNILKSPVSEGVKKIFYPTNMFRWDDAYSTNPFVIEDKNWNIVVKGMESSVSAKGLLYTTWFPIDKEPVICAIRNYKNGKLAVIGISHYYILSYPFTQPKGGWIGENNTGNIDGIFLEKGDGNEKSDGWKLFLNILNWLCEGTEKKGFGGYTEEKFAKILPPPNAEVPEYLTWREETTKPFKVLIGARSSYSNGKGEIKEFAEKAKRLGYSILVMTETFEYFDRSKWNKFLYDCEKASDNEIIVLPGLDIEDIYQNRYIIFGQKVFPEKFMLDETGKKIKFTQYLILGFGTHFSAIHRPTSTPIPHQLYKFFSGIVVYTYERDKLVDDGLLAYEWHVNNTSMPIPIVVHEIYSPDEIKLALKGHQLYVFSDKPENAAWYIRGGMQHFWEEPTLFLVSSGPIVKTLSHSKILVEASDFIIDKEGKIVIENKTPIKQVQLRTRYYPERIWRPDKNRVNIDYYLSPTHFRIGFFYIEDEKGNNAITPPLRFGPAARYTWRCSDRQNFFGWAIQYTGTTLFDIDIKIPVFGTDEGNGLWPGRSGPKRGENLCPLLDFPFASNDVYITDANIENRYWKALWEEVVFDAKPANGVSPSRVYEAKVRYYDFLLSPNAIKDNKRPMILKEIEIKTKIPVISQSDVFPVFTTVSPKPEYLYYDKEQKKWIKGKIESGYIDLPEGACIDDMIIFTSLRVNSKGEVGFPVPKFSSQIPLGKTWYAKYIRIEDKGKIEELMNYMGVGERKLFDLNIKKGNLKDSRFIAYLESDKYGVSGEIQPYKDAPYSLPLIIDGLNLNWDSGIWKEGEEIKYFGVFEGKGITKIDIKNGGKFYAGNLIFSDNMDLRLNIVKWDKNEIIIEVNNPTEREIEANIETPDEITDKYKLKEKIIVPSGSSIRLNFKR
jgi:hypothetical protein